MANDRDELMRLAGRVDALALSCDVYVPGATTIAADLRALAQRAPQNGRLLAEATEMINHPSKDARAFAQDVLDALQSPQNGAVPEGWVLVPRELNNVMQMDAMAALDESDATPDGIGHLVGYKAIREVWAALLAAAPAPETLRDWSERMAAVETGQHVSAGSHGIADEPVPEAERAKGERYGVHEIRDLSKWIEAPFAVARHRDDVLVAHCTHRDSAEQVVAVLNGQPNMVMPMDEATRVGNEILARANETPPAGQPEGVEAPAIVLGFEDLESAHKLIDWNREQKPPPIVIGSELAVFEAVRRLASAQRAAGSAQQGDKL